MNFKPLQYPVPPKRIRIGGFVYTIKVWTPAESSSQGCFGQCHNNTQEIFMDGGMPLQKSLDTFWHEVMHAFYWVYGMEDNDKEERMCSMVGSAMLQILRDNPQLMKWQTEVLGAM